MIPVYSPIELVHLLEPRLGEPVEISHLYNLKTNKHNMDQTRASMIIQQEFRTSVTRISIVLCCLIRKLAISNTNGIVEYPQTN